MHAIQDLSAADHAAYHNLRAHWLDCCKSVAAHPLDVDKPSVCEEGYRLYKLAMAAQAAHFEARSGGAA